MIATYNECIKKYGSVYKISKAIESGELYRIEKGIYSDEKSISTLAVITKKYPNAIITMDNAFYYHGLTDVPPEKYYLATSEYSRALRDPRVKQMFLKDQILHLGETTMTRRDAEFKIYDRERMLIELLRFKDKLPFDYYKEILGNYRNLLYELDIERIQEYSNVFPRSKKIRTLLYSEVF